MIGRPRFTRSIRFRITAPAVVIVAFVVAGLSVILVQSVRSHLVSQVDSRLVAEVRYTRTLIGEHQPISSSAPSGQYGQLFLADGKLLGESANLGSGPPLVRVKAEGPTPHLTTITTRRYGQLRILVEQLGIGSAPIILLATQINQIDEATRSLVRGMALGAPLLVLASGVLIWLVVGRAMRSVESVRLAVADVSDDDLEERVSNPGTGDELERLVLTMNIMLARLQGAIERERRFVADASHEIRSPIAAARALLESEETDLSHIRSTRGSVLVALQRLQDLTDQLLVLDGLGRKEFERAIKLVDVDELVLTQVEQLRQTTSFDIDVSAVSGGQVSSSEMDVMRIIENLSSNAVWHAVSKISFFVAERDGQVEFGVEDDGPGVPVDSRSLIFERFLRLDSARGRTSGGSGLGLAIVSEIVTNLGGSVRVEDTKYGGARFVVTLPSSSVTTGVGPPVRHSLVREPPDVGETAPSPHEATI